MTLSKAASEFILHWGEMGNRWGVNQMCIRDRIEYDTGCLFVDDEHSLALIGDIDRIQPEQLASRLHLWPDWQALFVLSLIHI